MKRSLLFLPFACGVAMAAEGGPQPVPRAPISSATLYIPWEKPTDAIQTVKWSASNIDRPVHLTRTFVDNFTDEPKFPPLENKLAWAPHRMGDGKSNAAQDDASAALRSNGLDSEQQIYVDPVFGKAGLMPFSLTGHILNITASHTANGKFNATHGFGVTSGMLSSHQTYAQKYGFFEISARVPAGPALLPAFRLLPRFPAQDEAVEINILQAPGNLPGQIVQGSRLARFVRSETRTSVPTAATAMHAYGALWLEDRIVFYVDRQAVAQIATHASQKRDFYMTVELAVGGDRVGKWLEPSDSALPASLQVDWIAAYTRNK